MAIGEKREAVWVVPPCDDSMTVEQLLAARRRRFTVDEYYKMAEVGILSEDERVELIEGDVLVKSDHAFLIDGATITLSPSGHRHHGCVTGLQYLLMPLIGLRGVVSVQGPLRLAVRVEPEPDVAVYQPRADFYRSSKAGLADVLWLVEVMDSTADYDRKIKLALYAQYGVPEVWLVDLEGDLIEVHRRPDGGVYKEALTRQRGQSVAPEAFPDVVLAVDAILG